MKYLPLTQEKSYYKSSNEDQHEWYNHSNNTTWNILYMYIINFTTL